MYTLSGNSLTEKKSFQAGKEVVVAEFSPDGNTLAIGSGRSVLLFDSANYQVWLWEWLIVPHLPLSLTTGNQELVVPHCKGDGHRLVTQLCLHCLRQH